MLRRAIRQPLCDSCSRHLLELFAGGFAAPKLPTFLGVRPIRRLPSQRRQYHDSRQSASEVVKSDVPQNDTLPEIETQPRANATATEEPPLQYAVSHGPKDAPLNEASIETRVLLARQTYGETLPEGSLSPEEYKLYERLYGAPIAITNPEDEQLLKSFEDHDDQLATQDENVEEEAEQQWEEGQHSLFKETEEGELEELDFENNSLFEEGQPTDANKILARQKGESADQFEQRKSLYEAVAHVHEGFGSLDERTAMLQDLQYAEQLAQEEHQNKEIDGNSVRQENLDTDNLSSDRPAGDTYPEEYQWSDEDFELDEEADKGPTKSRMHPLTAVGRSWTNPKTMHIPAVDFIEPVQRHLATTARYEHLTESAHKVFGGPQLPDSNATSHSSSVPRQQKPPSISASQHNMSQMEANLFMSAIMPGAYATAKSVMIEVRRRLGGKWLEDAMKREEGPRILDAGAGGAAVLAWRDLLDAQWDIMHENTLSRGAVPFGSSTVLAGSKMLQDSVSKLLEETSFIPRLPDFSRQRDLPSERSEHEPMRKQYDIIVAPYTLYGMEEDYIKKAHVQNLWSLLNPNGGVLIIVEKGVPKGFEAVAGAREVLLKHHIKNPAPESQEQMSALIGNHHTNLEEGMIIAPCTNHTKCPMYSFSGETVGRKDSCTFKQRYERPPFLQRIHGAKFHNYEDITFSYLAVQRGRDQRKEQSFVQNEELTTHAFAGYEDKGPGDIAMQTLPRILKQPLKRTGHVTLNVCTPHGTLERWVTPKSFSHQAYRDARKAQWGDLWALGAKTRVDAPARMGRPKDEHKPSKVDFETGEVLEGSEADQAALARKQINQKRRETRMRKSKIGRQPKYAKDTRKKLTEGEEDDVD